MFGAAIPEIEEPLGRVDLRPTSTVCEPQRLFGSQRRS
jgi:hypothetical protein